MVPTQFVDVIRLRPDFDRAHLNAGVALAKQGKLEGAQQEFQTALRLNPADKIARQNLEGVERNLRILKAHGS